MKQSRLLVIFLLILFTAFEASAQISRQENYWSVGLSLNSFNYYGDLSPLPKVISSDIKFSRPNFGLEVSKKLGPRFSWRNAFAYGRLKGDDFVSADPSKEESVGRYGRNLQFRNDVFELSSVIMYEFLPSRGRFYRRRNVSPYVFAGIAGFYHNPKGKVPVLPADRGPSLINEGEWISLRQLSTEGQNVPRRTVPGQPGYDPSTVTYDGTYAKRYSLIQAAVPVGAGVKIRLSDRLDLGIEMGFRILFFDHIDDVGRDYPDMRDLYDYHANNGNPELGRLAVFMANRSTERTAAVSGDSRSPTTIPIVGTIDTRFGAEYGNNEYDLVTAGGQYADLVGFERLTDYGLRGQRRGNTYGKKGRGNTIADNDLYLVTGFHLNYILTSKRFPRYSRKF